MARTRRLFPLVLDVAIAISTAGLLAQQTAAPATPAAGAKTATVPEPKTWTASEDHQNMMDQLGIRSLRPGPSGNEQMPNHANYDESTANPFPRLPDVLTLKNGRKVTTADMWWTGRRKEIVEDFEREVYGRVPASVPNVTWKVTATASDMIGTYPVVRKQLAGHVDNSSYPSIDVDIQFDARHAGRGTGTRAGDDHVQGSRLPPVSWGRAFRWTRWRRCS